MKDIRLRPMADFVLEQEKLYDTIDIHNSDEWNFINDRVATLCINYANFLKQKLELWMIVPCDKKGNILENAEEKYGFGKYGNGTFAITSSQARELEKYLDAKERCLLRVLGTPPPDMYQEWIDGYKDIDTLVNHSSWDFELTEKAIKQIEKE